MARDYERSRLFTRRAVLIGAAETALFSVLTGRLYYLQMIQGDKYRTLAEENRINLRLIASPRGQILDRTGAPMALNQQNYRLVLLPEQVAHLQPLLDKINAFLPLSESDRKKIERDLRGNSGLNAVLVRENLTWDQVATISLHMPDLPGADIEVGEVRNYPFGEAAAHLAGYVGPVTMRDLKNDDDEDLTIPGFRIGKNGVEKEYDQDLRGEPGNLQLEVNARGRVVRELSRENPVPGKDVNLSIDAGLQQMIYQRLSTETSAAAFVMDVQTGAVYALVSFPGFDPNLFTYGISQTDWDRLNNDEHFPLINKAADGVYAPGSTFKILTSMAALDSGLVKADTGVFCPGYYELGNHSFHCWKKGGHGHVNLVSAMAGSCDTYFYDMGHRVGIDKIQTVAQAFGLGSKTGIDLPHEKTGLVPSRAWKRARYNKSWQQGETLIAAIGQGYVVASPLQLCLACARIANGGYAVKPHLLRKDGLAGAVAKDLWPGMGFNPEHIALVQKGMFAVVNQPIGTAYAARAADARLSMSGKTGTAQVRRISAAERAEGVLKNESLPWLARDHALFVGYAPIEAPRYAVSVVVEHGGSGAHIAAPIARDILVECQKRNVAGLAI